MGMEEKVSDGSELGGVSEDGPYRDSSEPSLVEQLDYLRAANERLLAEKQGRLWWRGLLTALSVFVAVVALVAFGLGPNCLILQEIRDAKIVTERARRESEQLLREAQQEKARDCAIVEQLLKARRD